MVMLSELRLVGMDGSEIEVVSRVIYATDARAAQNMVSAAAIHGASLAFSVQG